MNITNKYCLLSELTQVQIDKLVELMPVSSYFHFFRGETVIGFAEQGTAGTWYVCKNPTVLITYKEMLSLLGAKDEELVPHVHQKEIIAWANGEEIEHYSPYHGKWFKKNYSEWTEYTLFRVKPKLTPTQLRIQKLTEELMELEEQHNVECGVGLVMGRVGCQQFED
jgi:hypothetical protein